MKRTYFFTAPWCKACAPVWLVWLRAIRKFPDIERHVIDMETDEGRDMSGQYGFRSIPTILMLDDDGTPHDMLGPGACGTMSETDFETRLWHWR